MCACPRACAYAKIGETVSVPLTKGTVPFVRKESLAAYQIVSINVADRLQHPGILQACKCKVTNYYLQVDGFEDGLPRLSLRFPDFPAISLNQLLFEQKKNIRTGQVLMLMLWQKTLLEPICYNCFERFSR